MLTSPMKQRLFKQKAYEEGSNEKKKSFVKMLADRKIGKACSEHFSWLSSNLKVGNESYKLKGQVVAVLLVGADQATTKTSSW